MTLHKVIKFSIAVVILGGAAAWASDGCSQGCTTQQYWKIGSNCIKADELTCCTVSWAVAVGGTRANSTGMVKHWKYSGINCEAVCSERDDSVAVQFTIPENATKVLYGNWERCHCAPPQAGP